MILSLLGCLASAGDYLAAPNLVNDPKAEALPDPSTYNCLAWPVRAGTNGAKGEGELEWRAGHALSPTPLPKGYVPVGGIVLDGNAGVVACTPPTSP